LRLLGEENEFEYLIPINKGGFESLDSENYRINWKKRKHFKNKSRITVRDVFDRQY